MTSPLLDVRNSFIWCPMVPSGGIFLLAFADFLKHEHVFNMAFRYCFVGVEYVDNTRVLEQWYPLIFVWFRSILVYNWCLSLCCCISAKPRYTHMVLFSLTKAINESSFDDVGAVHHYTPECIVRVCFAWAIDSSSQCHFEWNTWRSTRLFVFYYQNSTPSYGRAICNGLPVFWYLMPVKVVTALILRLSESIRCDRESLLRS